MARAVEVSMTVSGGYRAGLTQVARRLLFRARANGNVEHPERRFVGKGSREQRHRDVVDRNARLRGALQLTAMGVAVEHQRHGVSADRLLETARSEERIDLG